MLNLSKLNYYYDILDTPMGPDSVLLDNIYESVAVDIDHDIITDFIVGDDLVEIDTSIAEVSLNTFI